MHTPPFPFAAVSFVIAAVWYFSRWVQNMLYFQQSITIRHFFVRWIIQNVFLSKLKFFLFKKTIEPTAPNKTTASLTSLLLLPQFRSGWNFAGSTWPRPYHGLKPNQTKKKRALKIDFCRLQQLSHPPAAATPATVAVVADVVVVITRRATVAINKHLAPATASGPRSCPACPSTWACFRLCGGKAIRCYFFFLGGGLGKVAFPFCARGNA